MFGISSGTICGTKPVRKAPPFRDLYSFAPIDLEDAPAPTGGGVPVPFCGTHSHDGTNHTHAQKS